MRGLIIAGAIVLGPVVVIACVDGLATGPVGEEVGAVFDVPPKIKHTHICPADFDVVMDGDDLWEASVDRNGNGRICSKGPALVDDARVSVDKKKKAKKKAKKKPKKKAKKKAKKK